jgi:hypothetical protein
MVAAAWVFPAPVHAQGPVPGPCDFVTSGGFVITDNGKKANFGAHGGCKNGEFWGHVNFVDHESGYHVNGGEVTAYLAPFGASNPTRDICGFATTNRATDPQPMRFRIRVVDMGEPGSLDTFGIILGKQNLSDPATYDETYKLSPRLLSSAKPGGGNVQLHAPNASTTAPAVLLDEYAMCGGLSFEGAPPPPPD